jgi:uncharacterized protein YjiS (DUF1127 family)
MKEVRRKEMRQHMQQSAPILTVFSAFHGKAPRVGFRSAIGRLMRLIDRSNQRCDLSELDDFLLADIGVTRREAEREAGKWFWE